MTYCFAARALVASLLVLSVGGCTGQKKEATIPNQTIDLPKEGPMPAGGGNAPRGGGGAGSEQIAQ